MKKHSSPKNRKQLNAYVKYSNLAIQMMVIIAIGTYVGFRLDKFIDWDFPVFTVVLSPFSVGVAIWYAVKDLLEL